MHYTHNRACVVGLVASFDGESAALDRVTTPRASEYPLTLTVVASGVRRELRCRGGATATAVSVTGSKGP